MDNTYIECIRNVGISAHIDSGKTTLTERILFYAGRIHTMREVKGDDPRGATMDFMELERERGITIQSAVTNLRWLDHTINIIDTPGHVDFTIEVERALRVLDGAILVLCAVGGVQSQTITVDRQLRRYEVPSIAFINKLDRVGAHPFEVLKQLHERLGRTAVALQIPIGIEDRFEGLIDLVRMKACYFDGEAGQVVRVEEIPPSLIASAAAARAELIDVATVFCDELTEAVLEGHETPEMIEKAVRRGVIARKLTPVLMGSAYKNKGVQLLLDAIVKYLPSPTQRHYEAFDLNNEGTIVELVANPSKPTVALAFKIEESPYGQLTHVRMYQGVVSKGDELVNTRMGKRFKVGRLMRIHADSREEVSTASAGDIVAFFGVDCTSGDVFTSPSISYALSQMYVPSPVISLAVKPLDKKSAEGMSKALNRFIKEDPTFKSVIDSESGETIISGMGELHLEVYIERMRREYGVAVEAGAPQVAYRERITRAVSFDYTHKKQTGGSGQYGRVAGIMEPSPDGEFKFVDAIRGGAIPAEFIPSCEKGFRACLAKGMLIGFPVVGIKITINDGTAHPVDSSDLAFQQAAIGAFRQAYLRAHPEIMEPLMRVAVEGPSQFQGNVIGSIAQRRGTIVSTWEDGSTARVEALVPLSEMFGYSTVLRSLTQGKSEYTMEFAEYAPVPSQLAEKLIVRYTEQRETSRR